MYSTHSEGKSVIAERHIRTLKNKIYNYMTSLSKNVYIDKLDDIVNKYNNAYHRKIKMKNIDVKSSSYIDSSKKLTMKILNLKLLILLEYQNIKICSKRLKAYFTKGHYPNWFEQVFVITEVKNTVPWTYVISDLKDKEIVGTFYKKVLQKTNQKGFRVEKVINRKGDKLYVKWQSYDSSFNSWIDKKEIV